MKRKFRVTIHFPMLLAVVVASRLESAEEASSLSGSRSGVAAETILEAWRRRQENVQSFTAEWTERVTHRSESLLSSAVLRGSKHRQDAARIRPLGDTVAELRCELAVDGVRMQCRRAGPQWAADRDSFVHREFRAAFDGEVARTLLLTADEETPPLGFVERPGSFRESRTLPNLPMLLAIRPLHRRLGPIATVGDWRVVPAVARVDGSECLVLEVHECRYATDLSQGELKETFWVDPARDFAVRRYEFVQNGTVVADAAIDYGDDGPCWLPTTWTSASYGGEPAVPLQRHEATLATYRLNPRSEDLELALRFPVGALVNDSATSRVWIIERGGRRRYVTEEEQRRGMSYRQLTTGNDAERTWLDVFFRWLIGLSVCCVGVAAYRRRRPIHRQGKQVSFFSGVVKYDGYNS